MSGFPKFFHHFNQSTEGISLPDRFTFPFYYEPHPLAVLAADQLQHYLETREDWANYFGLNSESVNGAPGKMFGVLVVKAENGTLGFLAAVSGKLAGTNQHDYFVPPVFDMLTEGGFYTQGETELNSLNRSIDQMEHSSNYQGMLDSLQKIKAGSDEDIREIKKNIKVNKNQRKAIRDASIGADAAILEEKLSHESKMEQFHLKRRQRFWKEEIEKAEEAILYFERDIRAIKEERKAKSAALQRRLFENYSFSNQALEKKSLLDIFVKDEGKIPPSGAGECAAPKLLQYAFLHNLRPVAMAEFWWGNSTEQEVRIHKNFYPACRQKCAPILRHMLSGMDIDPNPMEADPDPSKKISVIYRDNDIAIIVKPHELLSVPGKKVHTSVYTQAINLFPGATGPLMVHRLDQSTSGLMVIALHIDAYRFIQKQFLRKTIAKTYVAILEKDISGSFPDEGSINLPLRVDLEDRPRQVVCHEYGRNALTTYKILNIVDGKTIIRFHPVTGRTHQLRVHAAHHLGLNAPIEGDDLYGTRKDRLYLHAETITFKHPTTREIMTFQSKAPFCQEHLQAITAQED